MRRSLWGLRKVLTMMQNMYGRALKEAQHLNSNVSTVIRGLMAMNGDIRSLRRGILLLNIKLTFYVVRSALRRFMRNIKIST
jgi:hypothetical protein